MTILLRPSRVLLNKGLHQPLHDHTIIAYKLLQKWRGDVSVTLKRNDDSAANANKTREFWVEPERYEDVRRWLMNLRFSAKLIDKEGKPEDHRPWNYTATWA